MQAFQPRYIASKQTPNLYTVHVCGQYIGKVEGTTRKRNFWVDWIPTTMTGNELPPQKTRWKAARLLIAHAIGKGILPPDTLPML